MLRSNFFWKLYLGQIALVLLTAGIAWIIGQQRIAAEVLAATESELRSTASLLREVAREHWLDAGSLQQVVNELDDHVDVRMTVIAHDGTVAADSFEAPEHMSNHGNRPEFVEAMRSGSGRARRWSATERKELLYVALRVGDRPATEAAGDGPVLGVVRTSQDLARVDAGIADLRKALLGGAGLAVVVALLLGFLITRLITNPLRSMTAVAEATARGQYDRRVEGGGIDEVGTLARAFNTMADELAARMETIRSENNKLLAILAGMTEGVIAVDLQERVLHLNPAAGRLLGVEPAAAAGGRVWEVVRQSDVSEAVGEAMKTDAPVQREMWLAGPPDHEVVVQAAPLHDGRGILAGAVVVLQDVTDTRRFEAVRRDFVANVSHELKTPLTAIRGLVETMIDDPDMPAGSRMRFLRRVHAQAVRLSSLVSDLLALSRVESGAEQELEDVDLRHVVDQSCRQLRTFAEERGVELSVAPGPDAVPIEADPEGIRQVVDNLVANALHYTPRGGRVDVEVATTDGEARLEVRDTGIGIEASQQERIFERFYRVDKARSREVGGTGLGLSIVKHVVRRHGGEVDVVSALGRGSTFTVRLPLRPRS